MNRKRIIRNSKPEKAKRERDSIPWRYCFFALVCGLFLVVGFFGAARQHFSSIDYGIKNSKLRKQIDELEAEKRRLVLAKEITLSPSEIKKAAKKIGLTEMTAANIEVYRPRTEKTQSERNLTKRTVDAKPTQTILSRKDKPEELKIQKNAKKPTAIEKEIYRIQSAVR